MYNSTASELVYNLKCIDFFLLLLCLQPHHLACLFNEKSSIAPNPIIVNSLLSLNLFKYLNCISLYSGKNGNCKALNKNCKYDLLAERIKPEFLKLAHQLIRLNHLSLM